MTDRIYNVPFLCTGNSARSILAETILREDGAGHFRTFSTASRPKGRIDPLTLRVLASFASPTDGSARRAERSSPGRTRRSWISCSPSATTPLAKPVRSGWVSRRRSGASKTRIGVFTALPLKTLDKIALGTKLREIGQSEGSTSPRPSAA